jgi:protein involved in polysaccharide export with SLBB domain
MLSAMAPRPFCSLLAVALLAGLLAGCSSAPENPAPENPAPDGVPPGLTTGGWGQPGPDRIRKGDPLSVIFADIPEPKTYQLMVREDGTISLHFGVVVQVDGKNKAELETEIHQLYVPRYYVRLKVTVETGERQFYVGGAVRMPSGYSHPGDLTVLKAIKRAGDFNEFANRKKVRLTRANGTRIIVNCKAAEEDASLDLPVYPGDKIEVPKKLF